MRVFVADGHFRKTLVVVRSLGRKGVWVTVGEKTFLTLPSFQNIVMNPLFMQRHYAVES
ncbi:MAG: hypothetical protein ACUVQ9_06470 [Thermodesulfobacteriota bacterium]